MSEGAQSYQQTERTRLRRRHDRARYDRETVHAIIDAALLGHVGYVIDGQPYVTPTAVWREGEAIYWHGSSASQALRALKGGIRACVTVAHLDALVLARSGFHSSINYRSVMAFGTAHVVEDEAAKRRSLEAFMERIAPGRWAELRAPTAQEMKATLVLGMELDEVVAKIRTGDPGDDEEDYALDVWAGVVPVSQQIGTPLDDPRLRDGIPRPGYLDDIRIG